MLTTPATTSYILRNPLHRRNNDDLSNDTQNPRLSLPALGILFVIKTYPTPPDGWSIQRLATTTVSAEEVVSSAVHELVYKGFLVVGEQ